MLQTYWLTDVDQINPLGIEVRYRTTRHFSIFDSIEAIRSVPKKYRTRYPALNNNTNSTKNNIKHTKDQRAAGFMNINQVVCVRLN